MKESTDREKKIAVIMGIVEKMTEDGLREFCDYLQCLDVSPMKTNPLSDSGVV